MAQWFIVYVNVQRSIRPMLSELLLTFFLKFTPVKMLIIILYKFGAIHFYGL